MISFDGFKCPVDPHLEVEYVLADGVRRRDFAGNVAWSIGRNDEGRVLSYRVVGLGAGPDWVSWCGGREAGPLGLNARTRVAALQRNGAVLPPAAAGDLDWTQMAADGDIVAYRIPDQVDAEVRDDRAPALLARAQRHMLDRAATYDQPDGERSMGRTVAAFNAITGRDLRESEGWLLLQILKDVRDRQRAEPHVDSLEDGMAYSALKAEARLAGR